MQCFRGNNGMKIKSASGWATILAVVAMLIVSVPCHASKMDSRIESSARKSYVFKTYLKNDDIKVRSSDGAVTLSGTVLDESHVSLAGETVGSLPGVKSVDNKLVVKGEPPAKNSDAWLKAKVKSTLLYHRSVSGGTEVDVKDGVVTLKGNAASQAEKDLTTEYAADIDGVKSVNNEMTVPKGPKSKRTVGEKIDDASITAQVKMTLLYHRSTSGLGTKVSTKRGVVTLDGTAANQAESNLASKLAGDVKGVKRVNNLISVK